MNNVSIMRCVLPQDLLFLMHALENIQTKWRVNNATFPLSVDKQHADIELGKRFPKTKKKKNKKKNKKIKFKKNAFFPWGRGK